MHRTVITPVSYSCDCRQGIYARSDFLQSSRECQKLYIFLFFYYFFFFLGFVLVLKMRTQSIPCSWAFLFISLTCNGIFSMEIDAFSCNSLLRRLRLHWGLWCIFLAHPKLKFWCCLCLLMMAYNGPNNRANGWLWHHFLSFFILAI